MKTYLSIDMDFWNGTYYDHVESEVDYILHTLCQKRVPIIAVMNHHQLTPIIDASRARRLVNIDQHSDLADTDVDVFECGTWVSYVKWRKKGTYVWMHRHDVIYGECNGCNPIFRDRGIRRSASDWKHISRKFVNVLPSPQVLVSNCVGAGLVLSPEFVDGDFESIFRKMVKKYNIPYKKGRRDESSWQTNRRPK